MNEAHVLTENDFKVAAENGISAHLLRRRFHYLYWNKDEAISRPPRVTNKQRTAKAKSNFIPLSTFYSRIRNGWDEEKAATVPSLSRKEVGKRNQKENRIYPDWVYDNLENNNISISVFFNRIHSLGWSIEKASTIPIMKKRRKFNDDQVREIRRMLETETPANVAEKFNVAANTIRCIKRGEIYQDVK